MYVVCLLFVYLSSVIFNVESIMPYWLAKVIADQWISVSKPGYISTEPWVGLYLHKT